MEKTPSFPHWPADRDVYESAFSWLNEKGVEIVLPEHQHCPVFPLGSSIKIDVLEIRTISSMDSFAKDEDLEEDSLNGEFIDSPIQRPLSKTIHFSSREMRKETENETESFKNWSQVGTSESNATSLLMLTKDHYTKNPVSFCRKKKEFKLKSFKNAKTEGEAEKSTMDYSSSLNNNEGLNSSENSSTGSSRKTSVEKGTEVHPILDKIPL